MKIMFKSKKIFTIILILCLVIMLIACSNEPDETDPNIYIALGDSVPSGYGLSSTTERYTCIFYEMLKKEGYMDVDTEINMATAGYTTSDVLKLLNEMTEKQLKLFKSARIITLNIGGNNILVPFANYLNNVSSME